MTDEKELTALDILKAADAVLSDPSRWTKATSARNAEGITVLVWNPDAVCFCTMGAVDKVLDERAPDQWASYGTICDALVALRVALNQVTRGCDMGIGIPELNDRPETTFEHVKEAFTLAIVKLS